MYKNILLKKFLHIESIKIGPSTCGSSDWICLWNITKHCRKREIKGMKVLKVALMVRLWYFRTDRWSSPLYMTILLLRNWDSFGKQSWKKEKTHFFTQGFLPIRLKFNGLSHIWLIISNLTSLQFSCANAVTSNRQLPTKLDLFFFFFLNISVLAYSLT